MTYRQAGAEKDRHTWAEKGRQRCVQGRAARQFGLRQNWALGGLGNSVTATGRGSLSWQGLGSQMPAGEFWGILGGQLGPAEAFLS